MSLLSVSLFSYLNFSLFSPFLLFLLILHIILFFSILYYDFYHFCVSSYTLVIGSREKVFDIDSVGW